MNTTKSKLEVAVVKCFFCGRDKGLVMNTRLTEKDAKAIREAHNHAIDYEPCDECKKWMEQGYYRRKLPTSLFFFEVGANTKKIIDRSSQKNHQYGANVSTSGD